MKNRKSEANSASDFYNGINHIICRLFALRTLKSYIFALGSRNQIHFFRSVRNIYLFHSYGDLGSVGVVGGDISYLINGLHSGYNLSECCVLTVKMRSVLVHNEELAGGGVGVEGSRH